MPVINANSEDPDQMLRSAVSDLGQHCLPMFYLWDARHKWVNVRKGLICHTQQLKAQIACTFMQLIRAFNT